ncbi:MAG: NADH-quinone oxidoreductase subunit, partial [Actinomycetota bacterium]|nr:NADH-quinone oxidoreductase subunit [Actinomycetota bacterium]
GIYIPRFCWHERMKPVGMCRMCLVEIEGQRGLPPACTATVTDGMVVHTGTPGVKKAQEGVLEFLLINHPLDCPVCDRGGECPLQDLTFGYGPGESRFVEEKRHFAKPLPISDLVLLDRERCILCARCTRFADEVAGDALIQFVERGAEMQVLTFPNQPFTSYFSGNTVQICPVGALLAAPYRFRARPWDLSSVESSCQLCSVGCRVALQSSADRLVRSLGVDSEPVNHGWLCDKGRFGFDFIHAADRITEPQALPVGGARCEGTWPEALDAAAAGLAGALERGGPSSVAVIGGARGTNEDAYAWARFAKGVLKTDNVDCQVGDGLPAEVVCGLPRARLSDCDGARAIVLLGPDLKEEVPVAYLRVKRAAVDLKVPLIEISAVGTGLTRYATASLRHLPGEAGSLAERLAAMVSAAAPAAAGVPTPAGEPSPAPAESGPGPAAESAATPAAATPGVSAAESTAVSGATAPPETAGPSAPAEPPAAPAAESAAAPVEPAAVSPATEPAQPGTLSSPGPVADDELAAVAALLRGEPGDERPVIVILGRPSVAEPADATVAAASALAGIPGVRFLSALRRSNVHGALDLGLAPGFLPGRVTLDAGRAWFEAAWGGVPAGPGLDTAGILTAAAEGRLQALVLLGADPLSDFPDRDLARRAVAKVPFVLAVDAFPTPSTDAASVFLPVALYGEKRGTTTNLEGRLLRLARKVTPPGTAMEDWRVAVELALRLGADFDLEAVDEVTDEIARLAPAHQGANAALLRRAVDGAVIPLGEVEEPVLGGPAHAISPAADSDPGIVGGPIESLVVMRGSSSAYGTSPPTGGTITLAPPSRSGAHPPEGMTPPPVYRWDGAPEAGRPAAHGTAAGLLTAGGFRLWAGRKLYDPGVTVTRSAAVSGLAAPAAVRLHPDELRRLGFGADASVQVTSPRGSVTLPVVADQAVPAAVAWISPGAAGDLVDAANVTTVNV